MSEERVSISFNVTRVYANGETRNVSHDETWASDTTHCPNCGEKAVWVEGGAGDYYVGPEHFCLVCGAEWYMPSIRVKDDQSDEARLRSEAIKRAAGIE